MRLLLAAWPDHKAFTRGETAHFTPRSAFLHETPARHTDGGRKGRRLQNHPLSSGLCGSDCPEA